MASSNSPVAMASSTPTRSPEPGPESLRSTKSFPRHEPHDFIDPLTQRASTIQNDGKPIKTGDGAQQRSAEPDAFEAPEDEPIEPPRQSVDFDDIPIELVSMTDNFIDSLTAKVHAAPPNIDVLSRRFQDFYATAAQHIQTHIASISSRQSRNNSPRPNLTSRQSTASILRAKAASFSSKEKPKPSSAQEAEQQLLTAEELAERKKARKALEHKRVLLEEAVERRLCEGIYDRIYRHRTTQDEAQDDKLRSKTAALALVGIGPADLGVDLGEPSGDGADAAQKKEDISRYLDQARRDLTVMNEKRYPLGKLNSLKAAHKSIVDTLSHFHPSSSADEIMPMLIYTLITMPPEKLNVISDSNFIQRFRWEEKLEGETAYCLTNLEAAITFLDTVDLASLRANEALSGPPRPDSSAPGTPKAETFPPAYTPGLSAATPSSPQGLKPPQSPSAVKAAAQRRRLSDLIQTPAQAIGSASDSFFYTADQGFKNVGNSLTDSYKFLIGKLRDNSAGGREVVVPRTLEDARKLVGTPPPEEDASAGPAPPRTGEGERPPPGKDDKVLSLVGGKKASRDRSVDSMKSGRSGRSGRSASSSKKGLLADDHKENAAGAGQGPNASPSNNNPALVDQVRNLGNSLNPVNRFSGMMRGFGRNVPGSGGPGQTPAKDAAGKTADGGDLATPKAFPDIAGSLPPKDIPQIKPPIKRFMELQNPADLKLGEVLELLRDYRRLAGALKEAGAYKE